LLISRKTNDDLWEQLQGVVQLASRMLQVQDPFFKAVQDPRHWCRADTLSDLRRAEEREVCPKISIRLHPDEDDSIFSDPDFPTPSPYFDPLAYTAEVLEKDLTISLYSGFHMEESEKKEFTMGATVHDPLSRERNRIVIQLAADSVRLLMEDHYTAAEKMVMSHILASTLVHEMMVRRSPKLCIAFKAIEMRLIHIQACHGLCLDQVACSSGPSWNHRPERPRCLRRNREYSLSTPKCHEKTRHDRAML
jgi:hypothetical protein